MYKWYTGEMRYLKLDYVNILTDDKKCVIKFYINT